MQDKTEAKILCEVFEDVRGLTKFYLSLAKDIDPKRECQVEGKTLNSLYWIMGHLVWAEHYLLIEAMTGEKLDIPWHDQFDSQPVPDASLPEFDEILSTLDTVHARAMAIVAGMSDDDLGAPNHADITFRAGNAKRIIIRHAIRHEPCHTGQVAWILKIHGVKTV